MIVNQSAAAALLCAALLGHTPRVAAGQVASPRITGLTEERARNGDAALERFRGEVERSGTPLIEPGPEGCGCVLVTFLWWDDADPARVAVFSAATGWLPPGNVLRRLDGSDLWHGTYRVPADARFTYRISPDDNGRVYWSDPDWPARRQGFRLDPANPDTVDLGGGQLASLFEGPQVRRSALLDPPPETDRGSVEPWTLLSTALGEERPVTLYTPVPAAGAPEALLVMLDGGPYTSLVPTPTILDNLVRAGRIPPTAAVFVRQLRRSEELSGNDAFARFLAAELVPALEERLGVDFEADATVVAGSSLGGLGATWAAFRHPEVFGVVLSQSGAYWWAPDGDAEPRWMIREAAARERLTVRFHLDVGLLETESVRSGPSMLDLTRHMRDVLCAHRYGVTYDEFPGGHEYINWGETLGTALEGLLGTARAPSVCEGLPER